MWLVVQGLVLGILLMVLIILLCSVETLPKLFYVLLKNSHHTATRE